MTSQIEQPANSANNGLRSKVSEFFEFLTGLADRIPYSLIALVGRIGMAKIFWDSGRTKVTGILDVTESTLYLFAEEYRVPLLPSDVAATLAAFGETVFPVLLIVGLATRLSALALLGMTIVIQLFVYPHLWGIHILWVTILLMLIARGGGVLTADHFIGKWIGRAS